LKQLHPRIAEADGLPALLGIEGSGARVYFQAFAKMARHGFNFNGRRRRPATDPVNALLSLGYTVHSAPLIDRLRLIFSSFMER
jgi:CRISPR-associated protein Cas1